MRVHVSLHGSLHGLVLVNLTDYIFLSEKICCEINLYWIRIRYSKNFSEIPDKAIAMEKA